MTLHSREPEIVAINRCKKPGNEIKASPLIDGRHGAKRMMVSENNCKCGRRFKCYTERAARAYVTCSHCATRLAGVRFPDFKMVVK